MSIHNLRKIVLSFLMVNALIFSVSNVGRATTSDFSKTIALFGKNYKENAYVSRSIFKKVLTKANSPQKISISSSKKKVTWATAITTLCKAYEWEVRKNYSTCKKFASEEGILASPLPKKFKSSKPITYRKLAILLDRTIQRIKTATPAITLPPQQRQPTDGEQMPPPRPAASTPTPVMLPREVPTRQIPASNNSVVTSTSIDTNFFANIALQNSIPTRFYLDEVYFIEGNVVDSDTKEVLIFLCKAGEGCQNSQQFFDRTDGTHFKIPVYFTEAGNFQIGIVPGTGGESRVETISVVASDIPAQNGENAGPVTNRYQNGKTIFSWENGSDSLFTRLIVFQNALRKDFIFRQNVTSFSPPVRAFENFQKGTGFIMMQRGQAVSPISPITLTIQDFRSIKTDGIEVRNLQESFRTTGSFQFEARALGPISKKAAITLPNGTVKEIFFSDHDLINGERFSVELSLDSEGTYIFEINTPEGAAVVNVPIYVGNVVPLLPDFFALNPAQLTPGNINNLAQAQQQLLQFINDDRRLQGEPAVTLDPDLTSVAQGHSLDMVARNFFAHENPSGQSPDDRRRAAGVTTAIRENLGKGATLAIIEAGLMRSPIHRDAIIDPQMKRVGIGIAQAADGYIYITQNFSGDPLTAIGITQLKNELIATASTYRDQKGLPALVENMTISTVAKEWSQRMAAGNFFSMTDSQGITLANLLRAHNITVSLELNILKVSDYHLIQDELLKQSSLGNSANIGIGLGIAVNNLGDVYMTVIYSQ